jgi:hypothetical protein
MRIYVTFITPVVTYASETWTVTEKDKMRLRIFERQILFSAQYKLEKMYGE